jgi:hypothetical protein
LTATVPGTLATILNGTIAAGRVVLIRTARTDVFWLPDETHGIAMLGDRIIDPMIELAGCSTHQRIVVAGSKSMELMLELHRRGYLLAAAAGNCGRPTGQYDVTLVDWRRRTLHALEPTIDWLVNFSYINDPDSSCS